MKSGPDEITLQERLIDGLIEARDAVGHRIAVERMKLEQLKEEKQNKDRDELLCET